MLNPWYVSGFTDGEGCFSIFLNTEKKLRKNGNISQYRYWITTFSFTLREDDIKILDDIKDFFKCGQVYNLKGKNAHAHYLVRSRADLIKSIIPHFESFPLQAKKKSDFILWKEAVYILKKSDDRRLASKNPAISQNLVESDASRLIELKSLLLNRLTNDKKVKALDSLKLNPGKTIFLSKDLNVIK